MPTNSAIAAGVLPNVLNDTVDLTVSGFGTVDAAIIFTCNATSPGTFENGIIQSVGFWDGTNSAVIGTFSQNGVTTSNTRRLHRTDSVLEQIGSSGTTIRRFTCSGVTDGIRLTMSVDNTSLVKYVGAILFNGLLNEAIINESLSSGANDITSIGFKPDLIILGTTGISEAPNVQSWTQSQISLGAAHNDSSDIVSQSCCSFFSRNNLSTTNTGCYSNNSEVVANVTNESTVLWSASAGSFDSQGFTLTTTGSPGGDYVFGLALQLADPDDAYVSIIDSATSTGNQAYTGAGFAPATLLLMSTLATANDTIAQNGAFQFGLGDLSSERSFSHKDEDNVTTSSTSDEIDLANILNLREDDGTDEAIASINSFDSDGFTLNYGTAPSTSIKILSIAVGDSTAGGTDVTLVPDNLTITDNSLAVNLDKNITLSADNLLISNSFLAVQANVDLEVNLSPDTLSIIDGALSVQADADLNVNLSPDTLSIIDGTLSVQADAGLNVNLLPDTLSIIDGALSVQADADLNVNLSPDTLSIIDGTLSVQADVNLNINLSSDFLSIADGTLGVTIGEIIKKPVPGETLWRQCERSATWKLNARAKCSIH